MLNINLVTFVVKCLFKVLLFNLLDNNLFCLKFVNKSSQDFYSNPWSVIFDEFV